MYDSSSLCVCFCCSQTDFDETNTGYLVKAILVHMDDSNQAIAEAVLSAVAASAKIWPDTVRKHVREMYERFRSKVMCDRVLEACQW